MERIEMSVAGEQAGTIKGDILIYGLAGQVPLEFDFADPVKQNRKYSRFQRRDISVQLAQNPLFSSKKMAPARLIDVGVLGVSIGFPIKFKYRKRIRLMLTFLGGYTFEFKGTIVHRRCLGEEMIYGIRFDKLNRKFEEHLLRTGLKLKLQKITK